MQDRLFRFRVRIEFLHHAATRQFRTAFIPFALFLPELFLDGAEFLLEHILLLLLLIEQLLFFRQKFGQLLIGICHFFSLNVFQVQPSESRFPSLDCLDLPFR